jgi:transposase InsO family protein
MVKKDDKPSLSRQCRFLSIGRTSVYCRSQENAQTLELMKRIDELYTEDPTHGARRMCAALRNMGVKIERYGTPDVFNTDQGAQFTSAAFTDVLKKNGVKISMDGRGRALDNVFVERLWRTVKYEDVYLKDYEGVAECRAGLTEFFDRYNTRRTHQSLGYRYPKDVFMEGITQSIAA